MTKTNNKLPDKFRQLDTDKAADIYAKYAAIANDDTDTVHVGNYEFGEELVQPFVRIGPRRVPGLDGDPNDHGSKAREFWFWMGDIDAPDNETIPMPSTRTAIMLMHAINSVFDSDEYQQDAREYVKNFRAVRDEAEAKRVAATEEARAEWATEIAKGVGVDELPEGSVIVAPKYGRGEWRVWRLEDGKWTHGTAYGKAETVKAAQEIVSEHDGAVLIVGKQNGGYEHHNKPKPKRMTRKELEARIAELEAKVNA